MPFVEKKFESKIIKFFKKSGKPKIMFEKNWKVKVLNIHVYLTLSLSLTLDAWMHFLFWMNIHFIEIWFLN